MYFHSIGSQNVFGYFFADIKPLETTMEKMLDKRDQGSKTFIKEAIKEFETTLLKRLLGR